MTGPLLGWSSPAQEIQPILTSHEARVLAAIARRVWQFVERLASQLFGSLTSRDTVLSLWLVSFLLAALCT